MPHGPPSEGQRQRQRRIVINVVSVSPQAGEQASACPRAGKLHQAFEIVGLGENRSQIGDVLGDFLRRSGGEDDFRSIRTKRAEQLGDRPAIALSAR